MSAATRISRLEQRWFSAYCVLGVFDADGRLVGGVQ